MLVVFNLTFGGVFPLDRTSSDCALLICWEKNRIKRCFVLNIPDKFTSVVAEPGDQAIYPKIVTATLVTIYGALCFTLCRPHLTRNDFHLPSQSRRALDFLLFMG